MKILDILRKLGVIRSGSYKGTYKGTAPTEMIMDDVYDREKDLVTKKDVEKVSRAVKGTVKTAPDGSLRGGRVLRIFGKAALVCFGLFALLVVVGMMAGDEERDPKESVVALTVRDRVLARAGADGSLLPVEDGTFPAGERAHLVLLDVAGFAADSGGKHDFDMSAEVRSPEKKALYRSGSVIGREGSRVLPGGKASAPYVSFDTAGLEPGGYLLVVKVVDKVGGGTATVEAPFTIGGG